MSSIVHELVVFAAAADRTPAEVEIALRDLTSWLATHPGFLGRDLYFDAAVAQWVDHVRWADVGAAKAAAAALMERPEGARLMALLDGTSVRMLHATHVFAAAAAGQEGPRRPADAADVADLRAEA